MKPLPLVFDAPRRALPPRHLADLDVAGRRAAGLTADLLPPLLTPVRELSYDDGATRKTLWRGHDGTLVESVLMRYPDRTTVCVSSQASLTRKLSTAPIVEQVIDAQRTEALTGGRVSNVVFMGMGFTHWHGATTEAGPVLTWAFTPACSLESAPNAAVRADWSLDRSVPIVALSCVARSGDGRARRGPSAARRVVG